MAFVFTRQRQTTLFLAPGTFVPCPVLILCTLLKRGQTGCSERACATDNAVSGGCRTSLTACTTHRTELSRFGAATGNGRRAIAPAQAPAAENADELGAEVATEQTVDEEIDSRVERHHHVADVRQAAAWHFQVHERRETRGERPEEMRDDSGEVTRDADDDYGDDNERDALLCRHHLATRLARHRKRRPEVVRAT